MKQTRPYLDARALAGTGMYRRAYGTSSSPLLEALYGVPGFSETDAALHRAGGLLAELDGSGNPDDQGSLVESLFARFVDGDPPAAGQVLGMVTAARNEAETRAGARAALDDVIRLLEQERDNEIGRNVGAIAAEFDRRFRSIIDRLRAAGVTSADIDPAVAIKTRSDQYLALTSGVEEFEELRSGIADLYQAFGHGSERDFWVAVLVRNIATIEPLFGVVVSGLLATNVTTGERIHAGTAPLPAFDEDMPRLLTWFVEHEEVEPWVATADEAARTLSVLSEMRRDAADAARQGYRVVLARDSKGAEQKMTTFQAGGTTVTTVKVAEHRLIKAPSETRSDYDAANTWEISSLLDPFA